MADSAQGAVMKLSDAIRLGSMLKPQCREQYVFAGATCALGAATDALGRLNDLNDAFQLSEQWPLLTREDAVSPVELPASLLPWAVFDIIVYLNDEAEWTREQIADWVETLESQVSRVLSPGEEEKEEALSRMDEPATASVGNTRGTDR